MSHLAFPVHLFLFCTSLKVNHIYLPFVLLGNSMHCVLKTSPLHSSHKGETMLPKQHLNSS